MLQAVAPAALPPARRRLVVAGAVLVVASVAGFLLALVMQWPRPVAPNTPLRTSVGWGDVVDGTATSVPLVPFLLLLGATALARSQRERGPAGAVVVLGLMGILFLSAGIAAFSTSNPFVPGAALTAAGIAYALLGLGLAVCAALAMRERLIAALPRPPEGSPTPET